MRRSLPIVLSTLMMVACGDSKKKQKSDNGLGLINSQEQILKSQNQYSFSGSEDLSN